MASHTSARPYGGVSGPARLADRRARLIDAAIDLYGTRGYTATGVKDLCRAAGLTDRYFYESFPNKAALFSAAFQHVAAQLLGSVAVAVADAPLEPPSQARAAIEAFVRPLAEDPRQARLLFVEAITVGGDVERDVRSSVRRFADLVVATARPHVTDVPDKLLTMGALSLVGAIQHVLTEWLDGNLEATVEEMIDYFVELLLVASNASTHR